MKKILSVILCIAMLATVAMFTACSDDKKEESKPETTAAAEKKAEAFAVKDSDSDSVKAVKNVLKNRSANTSAVAQVKAVVAPKAEQAAVVEEAKTVTATNDAPHLGTWRTVALDMGAEFEGAFATEGMTADFSSFELALVLAITEDQMVITLDNEQFEKDFYEFIDELLIVCGNQIIVKLEENGYTLADFEAEMGMSLEDYLDGVEKDAISALTAQLEELKKMSFSTAYTEEDLADIVVSGNTLTIDGGEYIMTFTRV